MHVPASDAEYRRTFWDRKILGWEDSRYTEPGSSVWDRAFNAATRNRACLALEIMADAAAGAEVLELGCGSAKLAGPMLELGARGFTGVDFSETAIAAAQSRVNGARPQARFVAADAATYQPTTPAGLVYGLGLLDWLQDDEIVRLARRYASAHFLFSFSERRLSASQWLHRAYVHALYGHKQMYKPRYLSESQVRDLFASSGVRELRFIRHPGMSFGCFVTNIDCNRLQLLQSVHFATRSANYSRRSAGPLWRWLRARECAAVLQALDAQPHDALLEVGTGAGYYLERLAPRVAVAEGIDLCYAMVQECVRKGLAAQRIPLERLDRPQRFTKILAAGVLEFTADLHAFFASAARLMRPGGALVVLWPGDTLWGRAYRAHHERQRVDNGKTSAELVSAAHDQGWTPELCLRAGPMAIVFRFVCR
jgi:predicted TPR repeat methyltransferase